MSRLEEALQRAEQQQRQAEPAGESIAAESMPAAVELPVAAVAAEPAPSAPLPLWGLDAIEPTREPEMDAAAESAPAAKTDEAEPASGSEGWTWSTFHFGPLASHKVVVDRNADSSLVEQFRRLAAALHHAQLRRGIRSVMISSAVASEGKTLTATNLALTLSHSYRRRVLLIDADLRRPTVHDVFQIDNKSGLGDILKNSEMRHVPLHQLSPMLWVLTAGQPDPDPMGGLVSPQMKSLLGEASERFDWVIVDTPPVALLSDANLLATPIDAALLVVGANRTPFPLAKRAMEAIGADRVLGVVLNRLEKSELVGGYGSYDYYGYGYGRTESKKTAIGKKAPQAPQPA